MTFLTIVYCMHLLWAHKSVYKCIFVHAYAMWSAYVNWHVNLLNVLTLLEFFPYWLVLIMSCISNCSTISHIHSTTCQSTIQPYFFLFLCLSFYVCLTCIRQHSWTPPLVAPSSVDAKSEFIQHLRQDLHTPGHSKVKIIICIFVGERN